MRTTVGVEQDRQWRVTVGALGEEHGDVEPTSPAAVSRYWVRRTFDEISDDPGRWLGLLARKAWFLTWHYEIPNNKSFSFISEHESRYLRILLIKWWILLCLAPLGVYRALKRGRGRELYWLGSFLLLSAVGIVLFFVNSRYRIPLWPGMAVLAGGGYVQILRFAVRRQWRALALSALVGVGLGIVSLPNWARARPETPGRDFFFRSLAHLEKGNAAAWREAIRAYAAPASPRRAAQCDRLKGWRPPAWETHFAAFCAALDALPPTP